jgi:hypothetical protein
MKIPKTLKKPSKPTITTISKANESLLNIPPVTGTVDLVVETVDMVVVMVVVMVAVIETMVVVMVAVIGAMIVVMTVIDMTTVIVVVVAVVVVTVIMGLLEVEVGNTVLQETQIGEFTSKMFLLIAVGKI